MTHEDPVGPALRWWPFEDPYVVITDGPTRSLTYSDDQEKTLAPYVRPAPLGFAPPPRHRAAVPADSPSTARRRKRPGAARHRAR